MKKALLLITSLLLTSLIYSQDKIYLKDGTEVLTKIIEINTTEIKYKKFSNIEGPLYTISKSNVLMIIYKNGETEVIAKKNDVIIPPTNSEPQIKEKVKFVNVYGKNIFSINIVPFLFKDFNISYERFFARQKLAIKIPLYLGYSSSNLLSSATRFQYFCYIPSYNNRYVTTVTKGFAVGAHLKFYPTGEGKLRGFGAIGIEYGSFEFEFKDLVYNKTYTDKSSWGTGVIYGGLVYHPIKPIFCAIDIGISDFFPYYDNLLFRLGINVGIRF